MRNYHFIHLADFLSFLGPKVYGGHKLEYSNHLLEYFLYLRLHRSPGLVKRLLSVEFLEFIDLPLGPGGNVGLLHPAALLHHDPLYLVLELPGQRLHRLLLPQLASLRTICQS